MNTRVQILYYYCLLISYLARTTFIVAVIPTLYTAHTYCFHALMTKKIMAQRQWTELNSPKNVLKTLANRLDSTLKRNEMKFYFLKT